MNTTINAEGKSGKENLNVKNWIKQLTDNELQQLSINDPFYKIESQDIQWNVDAAKTYLQKIQTNKEKRYGITANMAVQILLEKNGYDVGKIDGSRGPKTTNALKDFENDRYNDNKGDGRLGPRTIKELLKTEVTEGEDTEQVQEEKTEELTEEKQINEICDDELPITEKKAQKIVDFYETEQQKATIELNTLFEPNGKLGELPQNINISFKQYDPITALTNLHEESELTKDDQDTLWNLLGIFDNRTCYINHRNHPIKISYINENLWLEYKNGDKKGQIGIPSDKIPSFFQGLKKREETLDDNDFDKFDGSIIGNLELNTKSKFADIKVSENTKERYGVQSDALALFLNYLK